MRRSWWNCIQPWYWLSLSGDWHWRRNLFKIPSGKAGKTFVAEIARTLRAYGEASTLETVALRDTLELRWGRRPSLKNLLQPKSRNRSKKVKQLSNTVSTQPHAAYAATTHSLTKWSFLKRTVPNIGHLFQPFENVIRHHLLPALTGRKGITNLEKDLFALLTRLGWLGSPNPTRVSSI